MITVYFRTGGRDNFQWRRVSTEFATRESAKAKAEELQRAGYPARYATTKALNAIGLPETYI